MFGVERSEPPDVPVVEGRSESPVFASFHVAAPSSAAASVASDAASTLLAAASLASPAFSAAFFLRSVALAAAALPD